MLMLKPPPRQPVRSLHLLLLKNITQAIKRQLSVVSHHFMMLLLLFLSLSHAQIPSDTCCQTKQVGFQVYALVGTQDTQEYGCNDNCVYQSYSGERVCFKPGPLTSTCLDGGSGGGSWPTEPTVESNYTAKGEMVDLDTNMKGYIVGSGNKVVVWNFDSFGLTNPASDRRRSKEWADYLSEMGGFTVLIPDWFRGNNMPGPFPQPAWMNEVTNWTNIESDWKNVVLPFLEDRHSGLLSIGLIGFTQLM